MSAWHARKIVRFSHCDAAGIVYYPRYFDLLHETKEDWLRDAVGIALPTLIVARRRGLPIVRLETDFVAPSRLGDELDIALTVARIGGASLHLDYEVRCDGERRLAARTVVVHVGLDDGKPRPIDDDLRERLSRFRDEGDAPRTAACGRCSRRAGRRRRATRTASPRAARSSSSAARSAGTPAAVRERRLRRAGAAGARQRRRGARRGGRGPRAHRAHDLVRGRQARVRRRACAASAPPTARSIGRHFPAMTAVEVSRLIEDRARVEIEATAVIPEPLSSAHNSRSIACRDLSHERPRTPARRAQARLPVGRPAAPRRAADRGGADGARHRARLRAGEADAAHPRGVPPRDRRPRGLPRDGRARLARRRRSRRTTAAPASTTSATA